jgi:hypothetical protein
MTQNTKHTPGPWEETNGRYLTITAHGKEIARMAAGTEVLDNARLIAAAPDLHAACRPAPLRQAAILFRANGMEDAASAIEKIAADQEAAIAKATGGA